MRFLQDRVEHRYKIAARTVDDLQDLGHRGLLGQRLAQLVEEPPVLNPQDRLIGRDRDRIELHRQARIGRPFEQRAVIEFHVGMAEHHQRHRVGACRDAAAAIGDHALLESPNAVKAPAQLAGGKNSLVSGSSRSPEGRLTVPVM